ncbi:lysosomal alpha-glucosidase-like [Planococcus citri]|uniref:lysosomal alpha-glucosidase-like n=1 Tax=Planococcus citri TaxID=170843 RepID=UPI0031F95AE0
MVCNFFCSDSKATKKFASFRNDSEESLLAMQTSNTRKLAKLCFILIVVFVFAGTVIYCVSGSFGSKNTHLTSEKYTFENDVQTPINRFASSAPSCQNISDSQKFDCFPRGKPDEEQCIARGCCWSPASQSSKSPWCHYPTAYNTYKVVRKDQYKRGVKLILNITRNSTYPNNVQMLLVKIEYDTKDRLHVKILDANKTRWEPPYPEVPLFNSTPDDTDYELIINDDPFGFAVIRKETGTVIFDTRNVGGFIYSDQFLQMSALMPSKYIYGLGERRNNLLLDTDWQEITLFNHDVAPKDNTNLYGTHPFYLSMEKSGASHGVFLLNSNAMDIILQPAPAITYRTIGGVLDFYFFLGPSPRDVVSQYYEVIGTPFLPPYWSLGFHLCRFGLKSLNETIAFWRRNYEAGIPFDVQWNDIDYMNKRNDFTVSPAFNGLSSFVDLLHKLNMRYVVILDPGVASREPRGSYPPYDEGVKANIFIKNASNLPLEGTVWNLDGGTVFPDFSNPSTIPYWMQMLSGLYAQFKYDGIWLDMNEISNFVQGSLTGCNGDQADFSLNNPPYLPGVDGGNLNYKTVCMSGIQYVGSHYDAHNIYGYAESMATSFCLATIRMKRPFVLSRSTFSGSGHFTSHWTGDVYSTWDDMKHSVGDIISFNMFGIPMVGADICGFNGNTTRELCQRWSQLGAFYPFSRNHNTDDAIDQDPAAIGIVESTKKALTFRYHLLPYLYTLFWNAHKFGESVIRPMFFEFPLDTLTYADNTKFFWGPAFLIIPVLEEGQTSVTTYFPKGVWFDAYTLDWYRSNGDYITLNASLDFIPLYFRAGYIIPYQEPAQTTTASRLNPFGLYVAIGENGNSYGSLYWDDGESYSNYDENEYNLLQFEFTDSTLSGIPINWGYETTMTLNTIKIMGLSDKIKQIYINNQTHSEYQYYPADKKLIIESVEINLSEPFFVKWQ